MGYNAIAAKEAVLGSDQTTSGTTELTALSTTLVNPQNPARAYVTAYCTLKAGAPVAGDTFDVRLYKDSTIICTETIKVPDATPRIAVALGAVIAIANSGTQTFSLRVIRTGGTGTIAVDAGGGANRSKIAWMIVPGATT